MIRPATPADAPAIAAIWNAVIRDSLATFTTLEKDPATLAAQIATGTPWWVACVNDAVQGHATYGQFRGGPGYVYSMEHSIHLSNSAKGMGMGRALMAALESHARAQGVHVMVAGVSSENPEGQAFHARLGYAECGRILQAGHKWGRWLDLVLMQKILT
ncbi:GNAT family N-acetyltransferase [Tabrizicola oligotrophica]|uniref:N-acetyltransferase n=1 Tax=Tabrizicola oligotrophica TaxID=2710650 RepID=A0A6M0QVC9_9RHOB|nr:GNAT family N-acetyltransferase [Tabrizicola oligotrophica]NEY91446.1 N-acetyltransferase [Tabrizicola oligotrophica]